jgi:hypothetical protein
VISLWFANLALSGCAILLAATLWYSAWLARRTARVKALIILMVTAVYCAAVMPSVLKLYRAGRVQQPDSTIPERPRPRFTGPSTTKGDNSPANTGDRNTFIYGEQKKQTPEHKK